ncbi:MBL fold metallo-hydrolase [Paenibacillus sp. TRM 82003]|uniref:MBL fold metallo-hydrolase n=1 Tax=Kineococcus sp. TRM81007 TaxID=2925831 RepID=UPI001F57FB38|nr:MBL fold metallo-hydrolase [Kineococcus sp. TRM81007]MCI2239546.1 MBL fold metallo-hydrolase [Kineococcus sp. TRM81007]MCI3926172.1 MBL fold metallo-hydrolase [Paenibacillus sp. TRM 82003]
MTLEGTNSWVLAAPGSRDAVVVDPGPDDAAHRAALLGELTGRDLRCALVVTTHHHDDHAGGADAFAAAAGSPPVLRAADADDGGELDVDGLRLRLLRTPGHTADSLCLLVEDEGSLLTGDTVLGRGSTALSDDGDLGEHLASLRRLLGLDTAGHLEVLLPGHGPARRDARAALAAQLAHRLGRLEQVREALEAGAPDVAAVATAVHGPLEGPLADAARASVRAHLAHLGVDLPG